MIIKWFKWTINWNTNKLTKERGIPHIHIGYFRWINFEAHETVFLYKIYINRQFLGILKM